VAAASKAGLDLECLPPGCNSTMTPNPGIVMMITIAPRP